MKTIKSTPIAKFLTDHNLYHLLAGVADMPASAPLLVWLNDAVQDDDTVGKANKKQFSEICKREQDACIRKTNNRPAAKKDDGVRRRRAFVLGVMSTII